MGQQKVQIQTEKEFLQKNTNEIVTSVITELRNGWKSRNVVLSTNEMKLTGVAIE